MSVNQHSTSTSTLDDSVPLTSNVIVASSASEDGSPVEVIPSVATAEPSSEPTPAVGTVGEETVWEGRYSIRNYASRLVVGIVLAGVWLALELKAWNQGESGWEFTAILAGIAAAAYWLYQGYRLLRVSRSHRYRLTTKRIFFSSGFFRRRVDQVELVKVKDLFVQQSLLGAWLNVGTVYVLSAEESLPRAAMLGVKDPQAVMDAIWHHTRVEKDARKG